MTEPTRERWAPAYPATICPDCLYTSANGWDERETGRPLPDPEPLSQVHPRALVGWDADVEPHFSWHACHGCGCTLGGDRYDVTIVEPASKAEHVRSERAHRAAARVAAANVDPGRMAAVHGDPAP